jgi:hypothetical protein
MSGMSSHDLNFRPFKFTTTLSHFKTGSVLNVQMYDTYKLNLITIEFVSSYFFSEEASLLNKQIFETLYYGALEASCELAERDGPYQTYEGSPVSKGILQVHAMTIRKTGSQLGGTFKIWT